MDYRLTELQLAVMGVLWARGEATVAEVQAALAERRMALTTVATLLSRLEKRGVVAHRLDGRQYVYRAEVTEAEVRADMVGAFRDVAAGLFRGDVVALVSHLLTAEDVGPDDLDRVKALIESKQQANVDGGK